MKIGIDIDDVLTDTSKVIVEFFKKYETSGDGMKHIVEIMKGELPTENIKKFYNLYINQMLREANLKDKYAAEVINRLFSEGNQIYFITARSEEKFKGSEQITIETLRDNNIKYSKIIFNASEKAKICSRNNIDFFVDDSVRNCEEVSNMGIETVVFTTKINENIKTNIARVSSWRELENRIENYIEKEEMEEER